MFIVELAILIYSVILHEIAHGFVADRLGDPTARLHKRLTLNPIPHIDPILTVILPFLTFGLPIITGHGPGIIFGGAKPIPIDPYNFREPKKDIALTALAGPATNFAIAVVFSLIFHLSDAVILNQSLKIAIQQLAAISVGVNIWLALFNLIPVPPLDGSKVLMAFLPNELAKEVLKLERYGFLIIFALLFFVPGIIFGIIGPINNNLTHLLLR